MARLLFRAVALAPSLAAVACSVLFAISDDAASGTHDAASDAPPGDAALGEDAERTEARDDGGSDADVTRADADASAIACPDASAGPALIPADRFCVDRTEVTAAQYDEFLRADKSALVLPVECAPDASLDPVLAAPSPDHPVLVDWCGAYAFCAWSGKRLCGALGDGGRMDITGANVGQLGDRTKSEWLSACEGGDRAMIYPYGNDFVPDACAPMQGGTPGEATTYTGLVPVGTRPDCVGGYPGLLDLIGNASEWINARLSLGGLPDGGTRLMDYSMGGAECRAPQGPLEPTDVRHGYGIRCCASPSP
jgi:formylglycine-generating enzyme required for sulfatase activity